MLKPATSAWEQQSPRDTSLASVTQVVVRLLQFYGCDIAALYASAQVDPALAADPHARIPVDHLERMIRHAGIEAEDPAFGLRAARCWHPSNLGVLGHAWLASSTLHSGLRRLAQYWRIVAERSFLTLVDEPAGTRLVFRRKRGNPAGEAVAADIYLSLVLDMCRFNAGDALRPTAVLLRRPVPADRAPYDRFFGCAVQFDAPENSLLLARDDALTALPSANRRLSVEFDKLLTLELADIAKHDVVARSRATLLQRLSSGELSEAQLAGSLHMSRRTLQRKLATCGTSYQQLLDDTRRELGTRLIDDRRRSLGDIAFSLGYSQQSAFTRAFKRWTGQSPTEHRQASMA
ncbi:AraC family transcriptional regulator [Ideonella sp.]|uniref:AraC family transcriptional regulator n=1 Tax=Ideonella sp. TaxID=1929293 RepID=UPI003BB4C973